MHSTTTELLYKGVQKDLVPMFNQEVYSSNSNGQSIGRIDEILVAADERNAQQRRVFDDDEPITIR